ncbi:MAG: GAF domain-containing sensor histidine kinase [Cyanobacteria bacterium P01_A01_bin.83]
MSNNHISSTEFASLCQSQIALISQSLGAMWSVVYLTEEVDKEGQSQLFPFAIYPQAQAQEFLELPAIKLSTILQALQSHSITQFLPDNLTSNSQNNSPNPPQTESAETKQLILPLIHQETLFGLLVTGRSGKEWQPRELQQVEEIARTIAIARFIEFQYQWTQDELDMEQNLRRIEQDRLDNLLHQLRNPLTALQTFGKLLLKRMLADDPNRKLAQSILTQSDRFKALLEQFEAESSKLPTNNLRVVQGNDSVPLLETREPDVDQSSFLLPSSHSQLDSVNLSQILDSLLTTAQAIAIERKIQLINHLPPEIPKIEANLAAVRETLNNLIDNALKYTPCGGTVQLDLAENQNPPMVGIAIQDTGCGIPSEDQEKIFARHYRGVQAQGDIPGTGLGLAIAQELMTKMQGKIELISPNNLSNNSPGTTFIVWLPVSMDN